MSVHHVVDRTHHLVVSIFSGQVTCNEIAAACTKLGHNRDFRPDYRQLADLSQVSRLDLRAEDINSIRQIHDPFSSQSRRAFVVSDLGATLGTVKSYQSIVQGQQLQIFPSLLDAVSWLNLPVTVLPEVSMRSCFRLGSPDGSQGRSFESPCNPLRSFRLLRGLAKGAENW